MRIILWNGERNVLKKIVFPKIQTYTPHDYETVIQNMRDYIYFLKKLLSLHRIISYSVRNLFFTCIHES